MAKIKISELASELGCDAKELISVLQEKGIEAKRSNSSIEEADAEIARKHFKGSAKKADASDKEEKKAPVKSDAPKTEEGASKNSAVKTDSADTPKKKKKIIMVTNAGNSKMGGYHNNQNGNNSGAQSNNNQRRDNRSGYGNNNNGGNNRRGVFAQSQNAYHPIKPLTAPSQLESYNTPISKSTTPKPAPKKESAPQTVENKQAAMQPQQAAAPVQSEAPKPVSAAPVQNEKPRDNRDNRDNNRDNRDNRDSRDVRDNRDNRNNSGRNDRGDRNGFQNRNNGQNGGFRRDNNQGGFGQRGGRDGQMNGGQQGGKFGGRNDRNDRNNKFDKNQRGGFADAAPVKEGAGHRDEERRRIGQEKDKRNKKDLAYEQEEMMPRSKRVGRFIKPEVKKVEEPEEQIKVISIPEKVSIKELAEKMKMQPSVIIKKLFMAGQISTVNTELTYEEAENIAIEYDIICEKEVPVDVIEELLKEDEDAPETLKKRPPVVCVMGHVDHVKTSLLDAISKTSVTDREAGGITQRIGAYTVSVNDQKITFLDTPGHEAFTAMRMRGANSTDIAVLVVAADDGVMPQTVEAINHAKAAEVEIIVAVNKIDKPNANIDKVKQEMTEYGLISTDWGGTTEFVPVSAKSGEGIEDLLETIILTADILELKANPDRMARGLVLEARLDKGRGPVANVLVQKGTLHVGDFISAGASSGKVRAMVDDKGNKLKEARPSQPVEILGLSDVPNAGEVFLGHETDKLAKQYANTYLQQHKKDLIEETKAKMSLDDLYSKIEEGRLQELDIIIKADVQGSVEALKQSLLKLSNDEVVVKVIHGGVGAINESDVTLAAASNAIIIGFDVRPDATAKSMAEHEGVEIKLYKVIYQAIEEIEYAMKGMLAPIYEERVTGHAEVRQIFKASKVGNIAGAFVKDGVIKKDCKVRISREGEQIFEGDLASLKRFKDDVKEVKEGFECGLVFDGFDQIHEGDMVEAYEMVEVPRT
ncbi:MAG: translation initiation factor IF-2 [Butyrivibrio sp.]|uniref:translation initiation factor IF-2 n=1 Tax=Butyrivibrio sp. TaxID=28121 RepID=UPI001AFD5C0C|nr:translation initiation factor IF-2 [Butyrivibrio sp.]MBO6239270.1 translation initiation factor IF-2 [Butyrivibrio sp.]